MARTPRKRRTNIIKLSGRAWRHHRGDGLEAVDCRLRYASLGDRRLRAPAFGSREKGKPTGKEGGLGARGARQCAAAAVT